VRKQNRFSQAELAQRLEVSEPTISNYETGKREPDKATWVRLSRILGVSVDYLMGLDAEKAATPEGSGLDEGARYLLQRYKDAKTDEERKRIITAVEIAVNLDKSTKDE
jgi:transcriptional regulator with XRE-family HTH domain